MTGWFACDEGDETEVPNPAFPWQPVLQIEQLQIRLSIWFETKDACMGFITDHVIGKAMHPLS